MLGKTGRDVVRGVAEPEADVRSKYADAARKLRNYWEVFMEYQESFTRQRRNLILFSCLILFVNVAGAKIEQINLIGNVLKIENPGIVSLSFAIVLAYFLLRYVQYSHAIPDKGFAKAFTGKRDKLLGVFVLKSIFQQHYSGSKSSLQGPKDLQIRRFWVYPKNQSGYTAFIEVLPKSGGVSTDFQNQPFSRSEFFLTGALAALYVTFRTHLMTEYVFPILIALMAFASFFSTFVSFLRILSSFS